MILNSGWDVQETKRLPNTDVSGQKVFSWMQKMQNLFWKLLLWWMKVSESVCKHDGHNIIF